MSLIYPLAVYLTDPHIEAEIVSALSNNPRLFTIVRRCADIAELEAVAQSGIAQGVILGASEPEVDRYLLERLHQAHVKVLLVQDSHNSEHQPKSLLYHIGADALGRADEIDTLIHTIQIMMSGQALQEPGQDLRDDCEAFEAEFTPGSITHANPKEEPSLGVAPLPKRSDIHSSGKKTRTFFSHTHVDTSSAQGPQEAPLGQVISIYGTSGAPGRSTIALNLSAQLAQKHSVLLIDADTHAPSIAHTLGINVDGSSIAALARAHARGNVTVVHCQEVAYLGPEGMDILTGLHTPHRWKELSPSALEDIIQAARQGWDYIIVDLPAVTFEITDEFHQHIPHRDALVAQAVDISDGIVVVGRADVLGLHRLSFAWEWLDERGNEAPRIPVINMADTYRCGPRPVHSVAVALSDLIPGQDVTVIPYDTAVLQSVLRAGLIQGHSRRHARGAIADLARRVLHTLNTAVSDSALPS